MLEKMNSNRLEIFASPLIHYSSHKRNRAKWGRLLFLEERARSLLLKSSSRKSSLSPFITPGFFHELSSIPLKQDGVRENLWN